MGSCYGNVKSEKLTNIWEKVEKNSLGDFDFFGLIFRVLCNGALGHPVFETILI